MKKILILFILPIIMMSCTTTLSVDRAVEEIAWNTIDMISENESPVIAVYNLRDLTENGDVNDMVVSRLTIELANTINYEERDIIIVSRQVFNQVFEEHSLILSDLTDDKQQLEIGKLLGADLILVGDLTKTDYDIFNINTQLVNIQSGEVIGGDTFDFWIDLPEE